MRRATASTQPLAVALVEGLSELPPPGAGARRAAADAFADTIACMLAGRSEPEVRAVDGLSAAVPGEASVVTGGRRRPADAAFVNGTAAHALDFDDNFTPGMSHASAVLVPAILAIGEDRRVDGRTAVDAYLVGLQAQAMLGGVLGKGHYTSGWHPTSTIGCVGTAAAVAVVLGGGALIAESLSVATSFAGGSKSQFGTAMKAVHAGMASRGAVEAALLAEAGVAGAERALEGRFGFIDMFGADHAGEASIGERLRTAWAIDTDGLLPKRYASCGSTHLVLDALRGLGIERIAPGEIERIDTAVAGANEQNLAYPVPSTGREARFSMPYCVETFVRRGRLEPDDFTDAAVRSRLGSYDLARVTLRAWTPDELDAFDDPARPPHRVRVLLRNGRVLEASRTEPVGHRSEPFTDADRRQKFEACLAGRSGVRAFSELVTGLDDLPDLRAIGRELRSTVAAA